MKAKYLMGCLAVLAACVFGVQGAFADEPGWYVGGGTGPTSSDLGTADFNDGTLTSGSVDDGTSWKVYGGYQIMKFFAVEGGFTDLDEVNFDGVAGSGGLYGAGPVNANFQADGLFVSAVGIYPLNEHFSVFGRMGFMNWNADVALTSTNVTVSGDDDGTDPLFGVGVEFLKKDRFALRAEWESFSDVMDESIDRISGNVLFRF